MSLARSWVEDVNDPEGAFPLNDLPCGVFSREGGAPRCGVAIGDRVLDAAALEEEGVLDLGAGRPLLARPAWNDLMAAGPEAWARLRARLTDLWAESARERAAVEPHLVPLEGAALHRPFAVAEFTDFYAGRQHALNVGTLFRGSENALPPNWLHIPIGYNGRASTVGSRARPSAARSARPGRPAPRRPPSAPRAGSTSSWRRAPWWASPRAWASRSPWPRPTR